MQVRTCSRCSSLLSACLRGRGGIGWCWWWWGVLRRGGGWGLALLRLLAHPFGRVALRGTARVAMARGGTSRAEYIETRGQDTDG